jgi:glutathione S-transferase
VKFYNSMGPNPKLVRMFAAEKGYSFDAVEDVDLIKGANRKEPYLSKNPAGQLPCVELSDGRVIAETIAICELIEEKQPKPALIGTTPEDRAETRMWVRRIEWKITQPLADGFRFAEGLSLFKDRIRTIPEAAAGLKAIARDGLAWLDAQLAGRDTIVPGRFTLADIALYAFLDFGGSVGQTVDPALENLSNWLAKTKGRPSAQA